MGSFTSISVEVEPVVYIEFHVCDTRRNKKQISHGDVTILSIVGFLLRLKLTESRSGYTYFKRCT